MAAFKIYNDNMNDYVRPMPIAELRLGMRVRLFEGPYGWGTVTQIKGEGVTITRPYLHVSDFSYGETRVIAYTGLEDVNLWSKDDRPVMVSTEPLKEIL